MGMEAGRKWRRAGGRGGGKSEWLVGIEYKSFCP